MNLLSQLSPKSVLVSRVQIQDVIYISLLADARIVAREHLVAAKTVYDVLNSFEMLGDVDLLSGCLDGMARRGDIKFMDELIVLGEVIGGQNVLFCNQFRIVDCTKQFEKLSALYKNYDKYAKQNGRGSLSYQCGMVLAKLRKKNPEDYDANDVKDLYVRVYEVIFQSAHARLVGKESGLLNNMIKSMGSSKVVEMIFQYFYNCDKYSREPTVVMFNYNKNKILTDLDNAPVNLHVKPSGRERI